MSELVDVSIFATAGSREVLTQVLANQSIVMLLTHGSMDVGIRSTSLSLYEYSPGEMALCRAHTREWVRWRTPLEMMCVSLPDTLLAAVADETGNSPLELRGTPNLTDGRIRALMQVIRKEQEDGFSTGRLYLDSLGQALCAAVLKTRGSLQRQMRVYSGGMAPSQFRRVTAYIQEHLDRNLSLSELSDVAGLSTAYFCQLFRKSSGMTPHQYLLRARIDRSKELLMSRQLSVLDVAITTGFRSQQHFARTFRDFCHVTPTEYRRHTLL